MQMKNSSLVSQNSRENLIIEQNYKNPIITALMVIKSQNRAYHDDSCKNYYSLEEFQNRSDEILSMELSNKKPKSLFRK